LELLVDPDISKRKFKREIINYKKNEADYIKRGWWLLKASYPEVFVIFATPQLKPPCAVFGVVINFVNYDFWPPSVSFVDPFTRAKLKKSELLTNLFRLQSSDVDNAQNKVQIQELLQAHSDDKIFLCLPGVREYHDHPAHTGDSWLTHRGKGEGSLYFILNTIYTHGICPINGFKMQVQFQVQVAGFTCDPQKIPK
jgi:hypothetical protein